MRPGKEPSLWPREHGAYAEVAFPLLTGLALGVPSAAAAFLVVACLAGFLAHEPLLVILGFRGRRTRDQLGPAARRRLALLGSVAAATGSFGLWLAPSAARWWLLPPAALTLALVPLIARRKDKTALGEVLVAAAFSTMLVPVALASGVAIAAAVWAAAVWALVFVLGTFTVRLTLERARKERGPMRWVSPLAASATVVASGALAVMGAFAALAAAPTALAGLALWLKPVSAKRLRVMGWSLVGGNVLAFVAILVTLR